MAKSFLNQLRENPTQVGFGFVIVLGITAFLIWFFFFREKKGQAGSGAEVPELSVSGKKSVKSVNTSEYTHRRYEYAALGEFRGNNIDFDITITTKGGFEELNVKKISIRRYDNSGAEITDVTQDIDIQDYRTYNVSFPGIDLPRHVVPANGGNNTFKIFGILSDGNEFKANDTETSGTVLSSKNVEITKSDLNYTLSQASITSFSFDLTSYSEDALGISRGGLTRTKYYMSILPDEVFKLIPDPNDTTLYSFQKGDGNTLTVGSVDKFKLDNYAGRYRLYTSDDKILTREGGSGTLVLKAPGDMTPDEGSASLIRLDSVPILPVKARYVRVAKLEDIDNWGDRNIDYSEVMVLDNDDTNLAKGKTVNVPNNTVDLYKQWAGSLVDENVRTIAHTGTTIGDDTQPQKQWIEIDLGSDMDIAKVIVVHRDGYPRRLDKAMVVFKSSDGTEVKRSPKLTTADGNIGRYHTFDTITETWSHGKIAPASLPKVYPPKPYPNATGGTTVLNSYKWTVADSGYGEGEYRVDMSGSALINADWDGHLDAEGLFNKGISSTAVYDGGEHAYHSPTGGAASWFHFYLPVYIKLDRMDIVSRGYNDGEITNMNSTWYISGVDRSSGTPVETRLYSNDNVTFTNGETKSLVATPSKKFNEFKVTMDPIGTSYMVFNELLFYGTDESKTPA